MKFTANQNAVEVLNLNAALAVRFDPQKRARQNAVNLKVRALVSKVQANNQTPVLRRQVSDTYLETTFRISREQLNLLGITSIKAGKYVLKEFGAGYFELLPAVISELTPQDAVITVR